MTLKIKSSMPSKSSCTITYAKSAISTVNYPWYYVYCCFGSYADSLLFSSSARRQISLKNYP